MFKFFRKSKLAGMLYIQVMAILLASAVSCVAWFSSVQTSINTDIPSSILTSYFHSGTGTLLDPYVITKPVHYYNLVNLWENSYDGFDVDGGPYFQLGYKFDGTNYQFESYDNNGALIEDTYEAKLNMNYYSGNRVLMPIGSGTHPFMGHINGNGLTIKNVYVSGNGRSDIGIFGYVTAEATIENVYYDNVIIDCSTPDLNDTTDLHEGSHPYHSYVGYLAGHTVDANSWNNVYINNCRLVNTQEASVDKKNNYGYFGCVGEYEAEEPSSDINYQSTLRASDVYNYFSENDHYGSLSDKGLATRNTEYDVGETDTFSNAVTTSSNSYTMAGDTYSQSATKDYSLATVGYQSDSITYDLTYGTNHLDLDPTTVETELSPEEQVASGTAGKYLYWDEATHEWVYYITQMSEGGSVEVEYNSYFISWNDGTNTKYLGYVNDSFTSTTFGTPPTSETDEDYIWVLKDSPASVGVSSLSSNGGPKTLRFYSPAHEKYLYCATGTSITPILVDGYENATAFTISGPDSTIKFGSNVYAFVDSGGIKGSQPNATLTAVQFHFSGGVTTSEEDPASKKYDLVTNIDQIVAGGIYTIAYGTSGTVKGMSVTQNGNNRATVDVNVVSGEMSHASDLAEFEFQYEYLTVGVENYEGWSFLDLKNTISNQVDSYLYTSSGTSNRLGTTTDLAPNALYTISAMTENRFNLLNEQYDDRSIAFNVQYNIFSSYTSDFSLREFPSLYKRNEASMDYVTIAGAFQYTASTGETEDELVSYAYDVYRNLPTDHNYVLFDISKADVSLMEFDFEESQVTITWPEDTDDSWELVTDAATLASGDKVVIAAFGYDYAMSTTQETNYRGRAAITKIANPASITFDGTAGVCSFTLGESDGSWTFYDENANGYIYAASSSSNDLKTYSSLDDKGRWTIAINSNVASIVAKDANVRNVMSYNASSPRFSCYANILQTLSLYRLVEPEEHEGVPIYIGDKIDEDYNPRYIDVVGNTTFSNNSFSLNEYYSKIDAVGDYDVVNEKGVGSKFFNTFYASTAILVTVKKTGLLDLGTLVLSYTGGGKPMLTKGKTEGVSSGIEIGPNGFKCPNLDADPNEYQYSMSFSPHNILRNAYCTLDASGNIYSTHDVNGGVVKCQDGTANFDNSKIDSYILMITNDSSTQMNVTEVEFTFRTIPGNTGDFGSVGYRSAEYDENGVSTNNPDTQIIGTILNLYYVVDQFDGQQVYCKVTYDGANQTYYVTFYSTIACELNVFNYDISTYDLYVNGQQYYAGSNVVQISATPYNLSTWV